MEHVVIFVSINAVANSVMLQLYLQHGFLNIVFKIRHKLYIALGSPPLACAPALCPQ